MAEVSIDEKLLQQIAEMTGGKYFRAMDKNALESIYKKIDSLEKTEAEESVYLIREPLFRYPLALGMLCLLLILITPLYRRATSGF